MREEGSLTPVTGNKDSGEPSHLHMNGFVANGFVAEGFCCNCVVYDLFFFKIHYFSFERFCLS